MSSSRVSRIAALPTHLRAFATPSTEQSDRADPADLASRSKRSCTPLVLPTAAVVLRSAHAGRDGIPGAQALRLLGPIDVTALARILQELWARHEPLRTTFDHVDGEVAQLVRPTDVLSVSMVDPAGPFTSEPDELGRVLSDEHSRSFDLKRNLVFRAEHAGFVVWQRSHPTATVVMEESSWRVQLTRAQLTGAPPRVLPGNRPRSAVRSVAGKICEFTAPTIVTARLNELNSQRGTTLFMTLVAAYRVLFSRWSGHKDVTVGTVTFGQARAELESLIGAFVNILKLRSWVGSKHNFTEFFAGVRKTVLDAFARQQVPFELLVDELASVLDASRAPLCQAMVLLQQNTPCCSPRLPDVQMSQLSLPETRANFEVTAQFQESADDDAADGWAFPSAVPQNRHRSGPAGVNTAVDIAAGFASYLGRVERHRYRRARGDVARGIRSARRNPSGCCGAALGVGASVVCTVG
jgi:Condensation domain